MDSRNDLQRKKPIKCYFPHFGIFSAIMCSIFFSLNAIFAKVAAVNPILIALSRNTLHYMLLLPALSLRGRVEDIIGPRKYRLYSWLHGFAACVSGLFFYMAVENLPAGNAVTLSFLDVVFVPIIGRILFKEAFTILDAILAILAMCGVVLIAKPTFLFQHLSVDGSESAVGVVYGVLCPLCSSVSYILLRKMGKEVHFVNNIFTYVACGSVLGILLSFFTGSFIFPCYRQLLFLVLVAAASFFGEITLMTALQRERAGTVAVLMSLQIIFVYFAEIMLFQRFPSLLSFLGSGLIFSTSICIGVRKILNEKRRRQSIAKGPVEN